MIVRIGKSDLLASAVVAAIAFMAYAAFSGQWTNPILMLACTLLFLLIPFGTPVCNQLSQTASQVTGLCFAGQFIRFASQYAVNAVILWLMVKGAVVPVQIVDQLGGLAGTAVLVTAVSQGFQHAALMLANNGWGNQNRNVVFALYGSLLINAGTLTGFAFIKSLYLTMGLGLTFFFLGTAILMDLRHTIRMVSGRRPGHAPAPVEQFRRSG